MEQIKRVKVCMRSTTTRTYPAITVVIGDLHLSCDVRGSRDIRLAKRLADESGAPYSCEREVWEMMHGGRKLA